MTFTETTDSFGNKHIVVDLGDGNYKSFPADPQNPEYVAFLASQKEEK